MTGPTDWNSRWMARAKQLATWSKDPSTKVGCILIRDQHVVAEGYNGFPHGVADTPERLHDRDTKYLWTVHAEANAIAHAARYGHSTKGTLAVVTFPPCTSCATLLIQAGVTHILMPYMGCTYCDRGFTRYLKPGNAHVHELREYTGNQFPLGQEVPCGINETFKRWETTWGVSSAILAEAGVHVVTWKG